MVNGLNACIDRDQWAGHAREQGWLWTPGQLDAPGEAPTLLLAHGAGAPMESDFMNEMAAFLGQQGVNVLRFEFPYMAQRRTGGGKRPPDPQGQLLDHWRDLFAQVRPHVAGRLAVGGKSMGGRMASLLVDELKADALVCLGYPFYAAGKPDKPRVAHLADLRTPTLIVQGERDALGNRETVQDYALSSAIELQWLAAADHDLKPLKASGHTHEGHLRAAAQRVAAFLHG
ncbi:alpha/beta family hydrolase [Pseudomonas sp. DTU_2021_1001937_2_SI_NGA_ILE_001]|uniref:alpha/beta family hydrolase n=1 Tax=Pseudomonas sp. DTU_2021_1001937_2_SI_NGA_ILE_001 TaxID=3077589 RepID=UPI0028FC1FE7|nr:alpha/beta family hydrolase [Pseudomonas sp. DTU_2021_1001937_2_SI_NGA_ILE_001]WNW10956.1 alpha/beta family hydrolase [Pseudomonas sp. DTU_2021_1001937_2_SI_NGA_ILE_001]